MIGIWNAYSDIYLYVVGVGMLVTFGIPAVLVPARWAQLFRWKIQQPDDLALFMTRSLSVVCAVIAVFAIKVVNIPAAQPFFFDLLLWTFIAMTLIHIHGAITKVQPKNETIEIIMWVAFIFGTLVFHP